MNLFRHLRLRRHQARRAARTYPVIIHHDRLRGTVTVLSRDGAAVKVCDFCFGNCGQCGTSIGSGAPPLMDLMVGRLRGAEPIVTPRRS